MVSSDKKINKNNIIIIISIIACVFFILLFFSTIFAIVNINNNKIVNGIYINKINVSGLTQNEASDNFGKDFISGNLEVATDEEGLNVIKVHFTYVTETSKSGSKNATYATLKKIIDENKTWVTVGKDAATKVRIDTALALNDFYNNNDELVSAKTNEGGFVTIINELGEEKERNTFSVDMVITNVTHVDKDDEKNIKEHALVKGAIFNFRNDLLPVEFKVENEQGIKYFDDLGASGSEPVYTRVWGKIISETKTTTQEVESAFGEAAVRTYRNTNKEWIITGTAKVPYEFGDENILTAEELTKAAQNREVYLADVKKRADEYKASRAAGTTHYRPLRNRNRRANRRTLPFRSSFPRRSGIGCCRRRSHRSCVRRCLCSRARRFSGCPSIRHCA